MGAGFDAAVALMLATGDGLAEALHAAIESFETMGAEAPAQFARRRASSLGLNDAMPKKRRGPYRAARSHPLGLTQREVEVLRLVVEGASNHEISERVGRSRRTIEHHVSAILNKLSASNRMEAALRAFSEPWILNDEEK